MKTIDLVYFNAGGGHRSAALALETVLREQARPWVVRPINLMALLDPQNVFRKTTGMDPEDLYNTRLAHGWSLGLTQELKLLQALIRISHSALTARLRRYWRRTRPDMVVSLIPNFNRAMCAAFAAARPGAPYVTIMTDFADLPPHFWMEPHQPQHLICGTPKAVAQARTMGHPARQIHATSGMIIRPEFYRHEQLDRRSELAALGLDPDRPTGLVLFGGHGSSAMHGIARRLPDTQLILVCGHNAALAARLTEHARAAAAPRLVLGFTADICHYMQLSDFFIGKPGPGSISEAVQQGLPVIIVRNAWTMPQERYNTQWVTENRAGIVLESFKDVRSGVAELIARLPELRKSVARIRNQAIFEIPDILDGLLRTDAVREVRHGAAHTGIALHH